MADKSQPDPRAEIQSDGPAHTEARSFQLLPQLRHANARLTLQNGVQDLWFLSELQ